MELATLVHKFSCDDYYLSNLFKIQKNLPLFEDSSECYK